MWLKNIGISTVVLPVTAQSSDPRTDFTALIRVVKATGLDVWVRNVPRDMAPSLSLLVKKHGGPIVYCEGGGLDAPAPPAPAVRLSATDPKALIRSRDIFVTGRGSLVWTDVEDTLGPTYKQGVVSFTGDERPGASVLRRNAALLKSWDTVLPTLKSHRTLPRKGHGVQVSAPGRRGVSVVSLTNRGAITVAKGIEARDPETGRPMYLPPVELAPGETIWFPVNVSLAGSGLCQDCAAFALPDRIVYATAELLAIEYENGILAFEFAAPKAGFLELRLSRKPSGPFLAGGKPSEFEWNETLMTATLPIPEGKSPLYKMRIGLAIEPPDNAAFFTGSNRLILNQPNIVSTSYSSEDLASRSRLLAPSGFKTRIVRKAPMEIDYEVILPPDAPHGEFVVFALEADGVRLGRARMQLFRPVSIRVREAPGLKVGQSGEVPAQHPAIPARSLSVIVRNNSTAIQNFILEASGEGVTFNPPKVELSVAAMADREVSLRVFSDSPGAHKAALKLSGAAPFDYPLTVIALERGKVAAYAHDLDGDGIDDWSLESARARASFSGADGRWLEYVWKDTGTNVLPEPGILTMSRANTVQAGSEGELVFAGGRRIRMDPEGRVTVEQEAIALESLQPSKRDGVEFTWTAAPGGVVFSLKRE